MSSSKPNGMTGVDAPLDLADTSTVDVTGEYVDQPVSLCASTTRSSYPERAPLPCAQHAYLIIMLSSNKYVNCRSPCLSFF